MLKSSSLLTLNFQFRDPGEKKKKGEKPRREAQSRKRSGKESLQEGAQLESFLPPSHLAPITPINTRGS